MKIGIYVRVGEENKDLTELTYHEIIAWLKALDDRTKTRLILQLTDMLTAIKH